MDFSFSGVIRMHHLSRMREMKYFLFLMALSIGFCSFGQNQGNQWYFGADCGLNFNTDPPTYNTAGSINDNGQEGTASICDSAGNLLFYSDGIRVRNKLHAIMPNGNGLLGHVSATHSSMIVPVPGSNRLYYLFTNDGFQDFPNSDGLNYSVIDMCLQSGKGDVIAGCKNILLGDYASEKFALARHANGVDYWLVSHEFYTNKFHAYQVTASGIQPGVVTAIGPVHGASLQPGEAYGQMKISPNGEKICVLSGNGGNIANAFDFNTATGLVSNLIPLALPDFFNLYGTSFSASSQYLYVPQGSASKHIAQFDIYAGSGNAADVNASMQLINIPTAGAIGGLQLAPDGKIYCALGTIFFWGIINSPDLPAPACDYVHDAFNCSPQNRAYGFTNFMDSFQYENTIPQCLQLEPFDDDETIAEGETLSGDVSVNDYLNGQSSDYSVINVPDHGTIVMDVNGNYSYTPNAGFAGLDSAVYQVCIHFPETVCSMQDCQAAVLYIIIIEPNHPPVALDDIDYTTTEDLGLTGDVGTNDSDQDGDDLTFTLLTDAGNGAVIFSSDGNFTYTPAASFSGEDSFVYVVCDDGDPILCDTAMVIIEVENVNGPPLAENDSLVTCVSNVGELSVALNDDDPDGGVLTYLVIQEPLHGDFSLTSFGELEYIPDALYSGDDMLTYTACDDEGLCDTATVNIHTQPLGFEMYIASACNGDDGSIHLINMIAEGMGLAFYLNGELQATTLSNTLEPGNYTVTIVNEAGCSFSQQASVEDAALNVEVSVLPEVCGLSATFEVETNATTVVYEGVGISGTTSGGEISVNVPGEYDFEVIASNEVCTDTATFEVSFNEAPAYGIEIVYSDCIHSCNGSVSASSDYYTTWNFAGEEINDTTIAWFGDLCPGDYVLTASEGECTITDTIYISWLHEIEALISYEPVDIFTGIPIEFFTTSSNVNQQEWSVGTGMNTYTFGEDFNYIFDGGSAQAFISLVVTDSFGCMDTTELILAIQPAIDIYVPSAFTPDDDQVNDVFFPVFITRPVTYSMIIYDRWGEAIFETTDISKPWTGNVNDEKYFAPDGIYTWQISALFPLRLEVSELRGHLLLMR